MKKKEIGILMLAGAAAGVSSAVAAQVAMRYKRDLRNATIRVAASSKIVQTALGPVEYFEHGAGTPVLILHGAGGGYDQSRMIAWQIGGPYRFISISRFGYLRSPILGDGSPAAQADVCAALFDELKIDKAVVVGASAGGPSALTFALRFPERTLALVLISAVTRSIKSQPNMLIHIGRAVYSSDFLTWLTFKGLRTQLLKAHGLNPAAAYRMDEVDRQFVQAFLLTGLPSRSRRAGTSHDFEQIIGLAEIPLEKIQPPTLIVHAADDVLVPIAHALNAAQHIPNAHFIPLRRGGHLLFGQHQKLREEASEFFASLTSGNG